MAQPHKLQAACNVVKASAAHVGTPGTMTATEVDGRGWGRALFIFQLGAATNTATIDIQITDATSAGGSYANTAGTALTQIADTGGGTLHTIDIPVSATRPFMKTLIVTTTAAFVNSAVCVLYGGTHTSNPTQSATQTITL